MLLYVMLEVKYTCSLGPYCHSSHLLKRNSLKLCSYPFDWIYSNCNNIINCITDDFNLFLDKSYYIDKSPKVCGHSKYHDSMFNHHNPLTNIEHYNYYVRCVDRFKQLRQTTEPKLFVMIFINTADNVFDINNVVEFNRTFSENMTNYTLLVINNIPNKQQNYHQIAYIGNIHLLELHTISTSHGEAFYNNNDNIYLDNIIQSKYKLQQGQQQVQQQGQQQGRQQGQRNNFFDMML